MSHYKMLALVPATITDIHGYLTERLKPHEQRYTDCDEDDENCTRTGIWDYWRIGGRYCTAWARCHCEGLRWNCDLLDHRADCPVHLIDYDHIETVHEHGWRTAPTLCPLAIRPVLELPYNWTAHTLLTKTGEVHLSESWDGLRFVDHPNWNGARYEIMSGHTDCNAVIVDYHN